MAKNLKPIPDGYHYLLGATVHGSRIWISGANISAGRMSFGFAGTKVK